MRTHCTILSMETTLTSQDMAPLFRHLHLTAPVLACAPARLATGARTVSTRKLGCGQPLASLHLGCPPQYRLYLLECPHPTQVLRKLYRALVNHIQHYIHISSKCDNYLFATPNSAGDMEDFLSTQWESTSIRHAFIRKVRVSTIDHVTHRLLLCFSAAYDNPVNLICSHWNVFLCAQQNCLVLCLWAGLLNFSSSACRHLFSCCCLYICVSVPVHPSLIFRLTV